MKLPYKLRMTETLRMAFALHVQSACDALGQMARMMRSAATIEERNDAEAMADGCEARAAQIKSDAAAAMRE